MTRYYPIILLSIIGLFQSAAGEVLRVGVSVLPLEPVVRELGGEWVEVRSLQREGDSCSVFEPRPSTIGWLAKADLFFRTGVGYETVIMEKVRTRFTGLSVVDLQDAVDTLVQIAPHNHTDGHVCPGCAGGVESTDPHIWLDPHRVSRIAELISARLVEALPERTAELEQRLEDFKEKCSQLDARLSELLGPFSGRSFYIYHPALGYFADRYNLRQIPLSGHGASPTARDLHKRAQEARSDNVKVVFVQPQESRKNAEVIASAVGAELVEIDPMATNWEKNLLKIGVALRDSFTNL